MRACTSVPVVAPVRVSVPGTVSEGGTAEHRLAGRSGHTALFRKGRSAGPVARALGADAIRTGRASSVTGTHAGAATATGTVSDAAAVRVPVLRPLLSG